MNSLYYVRWSLKEKNMSFRKSIFEITEWISVVWYLLFAVKVVDTVSLYTVFGYVLAKRLEPVLHVIWIKTAHNVQVVPGPQPS